MEDRTNLDLGERFRLPRTLGDQTLADHPFRRSKKRRGGGDLLEVPVDAAVPFSPTDERLEEHREIEESLREAHPRSLAAHSPSFEKEEEGELVVFPESGDHRRKHGL